VAQQRDPEAELRRAADHVARTRERLVRGRAELARMQQSVRDTDEHLGSINAWIDETERHLRAARDTAEPDEDSAA
jgi:predicted  nucleic acid-binding Zn-ribbon protein